jgi:hypothetical protein
MIPWPDRLVLEIARRRCVLFLGAGVSRNSQTSSGQRPPLWKEFLTQAIEHCGDKTVEIRRTLNAGDFLTSCQLVRARMGDHDWYELLEQHFQKPIYAAADIHANIFNLDSLIVATSNVEKIYDKYAQTKFQGSVVVKKYSDSDVGRHVRAGPEQRLILKVHGCIDQPADAIFTREDYANARVKSSGFYSLLDGLITTQTFIFVGCGLSDPDILLLLENNSRAFRSTQPHYFITSEKLSDDYKKMIAVNYNLKTLVSSNKNEHLELSESLRELVISVDAKRVEIAKTLLW